MITAASLVVIAIALDILVLLATIRGDMNDLHTYAAGTQRLLSGVPLYPAWQTTGPYPLYRAAGGLGYVYPPTAALLLAPLVTGGFVWTLWNVGGVCAYLLVGLLIVRRELPWRSVLVPLIACAALLVHPGLHTIRSGNASPWIAAGFGAMWLFPRGSGWFAVAARLVKATPGLGILWGWRTGQSIRTPLVLAAAVAAGASAFGLYNWADWLAALRNGYAVCGYWWSLPSLSCAGLTWIGWLAAALLAVLSLRVRDDRLAFAFLSVALALLPAEEYWGYLLIPAIGVLPLLCAGLQQLPLSTRIWTAEVHVP